MKTKKHPTHRIPKSREIPRETPESLKEALSTRPYVVIAVLAASQQHYEHHRRFLWSDGWTRYIFVHDERQLAGLRPNAIIEMDGWWLGRTEVFLAAVKALKDRLPAIPA